MKALVFGDIHSNIGKVKELLEKTKNSSFGLVLILGDFTNEGSLGIAEKTISLVENSFPKARIFAIPGNPDIQEIIEFLEGKKLSLHKKVLELEGFEFIGIGGGKPVHTFYKINVGELEAKRFFKENYPSSGKPAIILSHTPPAGTRISISKAGARLGLNALREIIEEKQPLLCLSCHVHESWGVEKIGKTVCVNTGALDEGKAVVLELENFKEPKIKWLQV